MGAGELQKDVWHREAETIARRNGIQLRRWGMRVTVYNDSDPANNGEWVLSYDLASTNRKDNDNWLKVADIGATWGGGGNTFKLPLYDDGGVVQLGTPPDMPFTDPINIEGIANFNINLADPNYSGNSILFSVVDPDGNLNEFYQDAYASYFRAFDGVSQESGFDYDATFARILSDGEIILTGDGEIFFFMNYLMGSGTEMLVIDKTTGRIDSQPIPGGGYTFQNGITNTSGTVRWGGQLTGNTFVYSDGSARDVFFGYNPSFNEFPIGTFYVGATSSIQFNIGSTAAPQSFGFTGTGNFSFTSRTANTNSSNTQFMERRIISNGTPENNFGGREVVALEVASGASVGAVMHEYRLLDASGGGRFQWNVCKTYIGTTIPNTSVIQSFNTTDRTVSFFTKDDDFGGGTETLKIANTTLAPSTPVADSIMVYADDTSDNLSSIALYTEQSTEVIGATTPTHKLKVKINGTEYFLLLATV